MTVAPPLPRDSAQVLGVDPATVTTGPGYKVYNSFVHPREKHLQRARDEAQQPAARRAASQVAFHLKQERARHAEYLRNTDAAHAERQQQGLKLHPLVLLLDNVRSAYNVGNILRTAETAAVERVICCGLTPTPPHDKIAKTAFSAADSVQTEHCENSLTAVRKLQQEGYVVVAMETTSFSKCYTSLSFPSKVALVLGNEVSGVDTSVIEASDHVVEIPTYGFKNSLCVSAACPVVVFEVLRQWHNVK